MSRGQKLVRRWVDERRPATPAPKKDRKLKQRLLRLAQTDGDHCHGCRRPYRDGERSSTGYDSERRLIMVGECCIGRLSSIVAVSLYLAVGTEKPWICDDRVWFETNPERCRPGSPWRSAATIGSPFRAAGQGRRARSERHNPAAAIMNSVEPLNSGTRSSPVCDVSSRRRRARPSPRLN
jgi:hypothetical protein